MKGNVGKEKTKKDVEGPIIKRSRPKFQAKGNPGQGKPMREICNVHF